MYPICRTTRGMQVGRSWTLSSFLTKGDANSFGDMDVASVWGAATRCLSVMHGVLGRLLRDITKPPSPQIAAQLSRSSVLVRRCCSRPTADMLRTNDIALRTTIFVQSQIKDIVFFFFFFDTSKDELYCNGNRRTFTNCPPGPENSNILYY